MTLQLYTMTEARYQQMIEACQPVPYLISAGGIGPTSVQERANAAWRALGDEMGFVWDSVVPAGPVLQFKAEPKP